MKHCPSCGFENSDEAKFCIECGAALESAQTAQEESADSTETEQTVKAGPADEERWYYVDQSQSQGPFSRSEFEEMIVSGQITPVTYVWTKGMKEWTYLKNTPLYTANPLESVQPEKPAEKQPEPAKVQEAVQDNSNADYADESSETKEGDIQEWYYVRAGKTYGPYSESVIATYIAQGLLDGSSYVWKDGFDDWKHLKNTQLAGYLPKPSSRPGNSFSAPDTNTYQPGSNTLPAPHNVVVYILLSIFTCGIFYVVWVYMLARDINMLAARHNQPQGPDPVLAVILSLVTCDLYQIYFYWKEGTSVYQLSEGRLSDNAGILAILGFFLPIASAAILQDQLNTLIANED